MAATTPFADADTGFRQVGVWREARSSPDVRSLQFSGTRESVRVRAVVSAGETDAD